VGPQPAQAPPRQKHQRMCVDINNDVVRSTIMNFNDHKSKIYKRNLYSK